jgi:hypothetical protein
VTTPPGHLRALASASTARAISRVGAPVLAALVQASEKFPMPSLVRERILRRWGIRNAGAPIPRGVRFSNRFVRFEPGSSVSKGCSFEGQAPIRVGSGVHLRGPLLLTTTSSRGGSFPGLSMHVDVPLDVTHGEAEQPLSCRPGIRRSKGADLD